MQLKENKWLIFISAGLMIFLANIDATIVNLALAVIVQHLHANLAQTQWIINSYLLTTTIFFIIGGKLAVELDLFSDVLNMKRSRYIKDETVQIYSEEKQPIAQYCFHRSLTTIFNKLFNVDLVLDGFVEPAFTDLDFKEDISWKKLPELPPVLICRCRFL